MSRSGRSRPIASAADGRWGSAGDRGIWLLCKNAVREFKPENMLQTPPAVQAPSAPTSLNKLAAGINSAHAQCEESRKNFLKYACRAGDLLTQAKTQVEHGDWLRWIKGNCTFSDRTARAYMQVFRHWEVISSKMAGSADLTTIEGALKLLTPETEVLEAEILEQDAPLPPAAKYSTSTIERSTSSESHSTASQAKPTQVTGWPAAQIDDFAPGAICRIVDSNRKDFGKKVEILEMATYYLAVVRCLDNNEKFSLRTEQLKPLQRSPNYYLHQCLCGIGIPHSLALTLLHQIADQVKLPCDVLDEISKF